MRYKQTIPNFRNVGVVLRVLMIVNLLLISVCVFESQNLEVFTRWMMQYSAITQPILILSLLVLYISQVWLNRMRYRQGIVLMWLLVMMSVTLVQLGLNQIDYLDNLPSVSRCWLITSLIFALLIYYFNVMTQMHSPALDEAKLQALQARIRPHFLFNSINAVLSLIRSQPKQAETALEDMADLFRVLMSDHRDLIPLRQELALCKQYLALEKLRLEERLSVNWQIEEASQEVMIPPLILQPLIENAVYHGIEPILEGGLISIQTYITQRRLHVVLKNPMDISVHKDAFNHQQKNVQHQGNKMALNNIKARLKLHFDVEATLETTQKDGFYQVNIMIPYTEL